LFTRGRHKPGPTKSGSSSATELKTRVYDAEIPGTCTKGSAEEALLLPREIAATVVDAALILFGALVGAPIEAGAILLRPNRI
jgi:hypothetical protein